ncbi:HlyD family efflux transporter periplasmic adaptor subunit [Photobacterium iliopiscarium]|uniref:Hemolysin D n=1 Tax=Photobacterium iliopiscarium TaxID=56192 RepID=A0A2T3MJG5_9GAMM|nr:HlyD family efflux transporter periplasmic adaptor subunit [Photobacterium iliopiscarium]PSV95625.1 hemolysin D [Photobacterium iliopiscarium]
MTKQPLNSTSKKKRNTILGVFIVIVMAVAVTIYLLMPTTSQSTDDAYVAGQRIMITAQEAGTVNAINVDDTQHVEQGAQLVTLNRNPLLLKQQQAEANLRNTVRDVQSNYLKIAQLKAQIAAEKVMLAQAKQDYKRRIGGDKDGSVLAEVLSHAKNAVMIKEQNLIALNKQLQALQTLLPQEHILDNPQVQMAIAQLRHVYLDQQNATIYAPKGGMVVNRSVQVGQQIQAGQALMTIVPLDNVWVEANFKETQLHNMQTGQPVTIQSDLYGDKYTYTGVVAGIGAGTGSAFSAIPAQNATGNWIKIIQRVPVRIYIDSQQIKQHPLRVGMSMAVTVDTKATVKQPFDYAVFTANESAQKTTNKRLAVVDKKVEIFVNRLIKA